MIAAELKQRLDPILARHEAVRRWRALIFCWLGVAVLAGLMLWQHKATGWTSNRAWIVVVALGVVGAFGILWKLKQTSLDYRWLARRLEKSHPELQTSLLAAIEQKPEGVNGDFSFLQKRLFKEIGERCEEQAWGVETENALSKLRVANTVVFMIAALAVAAVSFLPPAPDGFVAGGKQAGEVEISPGDAEVERGAGMVVLARFPGAVPAEATLILTPATGQPQRIPLSKNLNDPIFGASLPSVQGDMKYEVEYGRTKTREFAVKVYEHPALLRADATLKFPEYTGLPERKVEETTRVSAVEGTQMEYVFQMNKPVTEAKLRALNGDELVLKQDAAKPNVWVANFPLEKSQRYKLLLRDADGRTNKSPSEVVLNAIVNKPPDMKLLAPKGDPRVSPIEELRFEAQVADDFGVKSYGLAYSLAGQEPKYVELGKDSQANQKKVFQHLLAMEKLTVEPDELVSYFVWADDYGPDGKLRRNMGDIYFAEIRPFDEIFRQGQGGEEGGGGGGGGGSMQQLGDLQKQIVIATWKLQRRETKATVSEPFKKDVEAVRQAQEQMLQQTEEKAGEVTDPNLAKYVDLAMKEMKKAVEQLSQAEQKNSAKPLPLALSAEQSAMRALAKLQPRETEVSQSKKKGGGGGGGGKQKQLDQMEMKQAEDRYEKEKQATAMQNEQQKEQLQFLNRLRELAQRQDDLNERLKELQTALQEAKNAEQRAEIERQLKRLREEERQMLADVDELRQKMDESQSAQQTAEARDQLDKTREDIRRASEEIEKGAVSQALAAGNRAQRDLEQMKEEMRKQTSNEFAEAMRGMRDEARKLSEKQEELAGQMREDTKKGARKSLTDANDKEGVTEGLKQQRERYNELVKDLKEVTQAAETSEPLLAKQLYETVRKAEQEKTENLLEMTEELFKRGFAPQSQQYEEKARASLDQVRQGVERAAESVLGNEVEAMRYAERQLKNLSEQLEKEIAKGDPSLAQAGQGKRDPSSTNRVAAAGNGSSTNRLAGGTNQLAMAGGKSSQKGKDGQQPGQNGEQKGQGGKAGEGKQPGGEQGKDGQPGQGGQKGKQGEGKQGEGQGQGQGEGQKQMASNQGQKGKGQGQGQGEGEGEGQGEQPGQKGKGKGQGQGQGVGQGQGEGQQPGQGQGQGGQKGGNQRSGNQQMAGGGRGGSEGGGIDLFNNRDGGWEGGPLTGERFTQWSDRLREVEESIDSPELRAEVARVRDRAREVRVEFKRHSKEPQWDLVQAEISKPMTEIRAKLQQEIAKRESKEALVPIDRDPVPGRFSELVRRYYEKLGGND